MTGNSSITITLTDIWGAWTSFRKGKKPSRAILRFEEDLEANLICLCYDLNADRYEHRAYSHRIINEKKRRDIYVASVRDRVVHRLLYDYLVPIIDPKLDYDVWSCRGGKGLHSCLTRTEQLLAKYPTAWVWRADITKFFDSVPHNKLMQVIEKQIGCSFTKDLLHRVINSYSCIIRSQPASQPVGLPIGNLTSQILSNLYMNEFDRFVRHSIRPLAYVRYGDDFVLLCSKRADIDLAKKLSTERLHRLGLNINSTHNQIIRSWQGLHFLGHVINKNGSVISRKTKGLMLRRLSIKNISSYSSLKIDEELRRTMPWLIDL